MSRVAIPNDPVSFSAIDRAARGGTDVTPWTMLLTRQTLKSSGLLEK
jgi:hypothetical protein